MNTPRFLYEKVYCARGDVENRIKELKDLQLDRTSCCRLRANQLRVFLTAAAYWSVTSQYSDTDMGYSTQSSTNHSTANQNV